MRAAELDLIFVAEFGLADPGHWLARWRAKLSSARFVAPFAAAQAAQAVTQSAAAAKKPIFFIAHSTGAIAVAQAAPALQSFDVRGAFLVAPPAPATLASLDGGRFGPAPRAALPFAAALVASRSDPWATFDESRAMAAEWGAELIDAGEAGRIDAASGHGPWPEGLLRLAGLFKRL